MLAALAAEDVLAADETPVNVLDRTAPQPAGRRKTKEKNKDPEEKEGKAAAGRAARADHPDPGRAADVPAGHRPRGAKTPSPPGSRPRSPGT